VKNRKKVKKLKVFFQQKFGEHNLHKQVVKETKKEKPKQNEQHKHRRKHPNHLQ